MNICPNPKCRKPINEPEKQVEWPESIQHGQPWFGLGGRPKTCGRADCTRIMKRMVKRREPSGRVSYRNKHKLDWQMKNGQGFDSIDEFLSFVRNSKSVNSITGVDDKLDF